MYNKMILVGRLGKDAEQRGKESKVTSFDIVTNNYYRKKDGEAVHETEWTACIAFGKLGELILEQGKKGDLVVCEGMKKTNTYEKDGQTLTKTIMQVDRYVRLQWSEHAKSKELNGVVPDLLGHTKIPDGLQ